jgi:hypothetical protein
MIVKKIEQKRGILFKALYLKMSSCFLIRFYYAPCEPVVHTGSPRTRVF